MRTVTIHDKRLWGALLAAGLAAACTPSAAPAGSSSRPPSAVYWLTLDSLRADTLHATRNGRRLMPALSELAQKSVLFENAYAQSSFTKISVASMFTGLWPQRLGVKHCAIDVHPEGVELCFGLDFGFATLAERLAAAGWLTISHPFTVHVRPGDGLLQGFQSQEVARERAPLLRQLFPWRVGAERLRGRPVFVYHHLIGVHAPYRPSPEARAALSLPTVTRFDPGGTDWFAAELSQRDLQDLHAFYEGVAWDVDRRAAELLEGLKASGAWNDALVIVSSDHGEEFLEHGRTQHSSQLYEESLRVPLLVKFPEASAEARFHGRRVAERVRLIDVAPTVLHLALGVEPVDGDGKSLLPLLQGRGTSPPGRRVHAFLSTMRSVAGKPRLFEQQAVIDGRFKALFGWRADASQGGLRRFERGEAIEELYDLAADADEHHNLVQERSDLWRALVGLSQAATARPEMEGGASRATSPDLKERREIEERLRALGYIR
jgi:arylsulfatase A-like enzyme